MLLSMILLTAWTTRGYRLVYFLASRQLTPQANALVRQVIGTSLASYASKGNVENQNLFICLPPALTRNDFDKAVASAPRPNIYQALIQNENQFTGTTLNKNQAAATLRNILTLIADIHDPLHVRIMGDTACKSPQWKEALKGQHLYELACFKFDPSDIDSYIGTWNKLSTDTIQKWQNDPVMDWLWESYSSSSDWQRNFRNVNSVGRNKLNSPFYNKMKARMQKAAIRMAGVLNEWGRSGWYNGHLAPPPPPGPIPRIEKDSAHH